MLYYKKKCVVLGCKSKTNLRLRTFPDAKDKEKFLMVESLWKCRAAAAV